MNGLLFGLVIIAGGTAVFLAKSTLRRWNSLALVRENPIRTA